MSATVKYNLVSHNKIKFISFAILNSSFQSKLIIEKISLTRKTDPRKEYLELASFKSLINQR